MRALLVAPLLAFVLASPAAAGKPKPAVAKAALESWVKAMHGTDAAKKTGFDAPAKLSSTPFRALVEDGDGVRCDVTAERPKLMDALVCISNHASYGRFKPYTKKALKGLWGEVKQARAEIEALAKTHVLFVHEERGEDVSELVIAAVTADADGSARVAAVFSSYITR